MDLSLKELKAEVRKLRKEHCPPVSRLKKEALKKEHAHLASLGMKSPNIVKEEVKEEVVEKKMPKLVRRLKPETVEVKEVVKEVSKRKPSAYAEFVKKHMKPGMSMKQVAEMYKKSKK